MKNVNRILNNKSKKKKKLTAIKKKKINIFPIFLETEPLPVKKKNQ